jgi:putative nucleotidyltransferase with HDIG domain
MDHYASHASIINFAGRLREVCTLYRVGQFWKALTAVSDPQDLALVRQVLPPQLMALFLSLQTSEQMHSLSVLDQLRQQGETNEDLWVAALLHDIGKTRYPLRLWERVIIVMGNTFFPRRAKAWGQAEPHGWKRPFVVAEQHAVWGAEMAASAGASSLAVKLIRRHQDLSKQPLPDGSLLHSETLEDQLLYRLKVADDKG